MMPTDCSVRCTPTILPIIRISWDCHPTFRLILGRGSCLHPPMSKLMLWGMGKKPAGVSGMWRRLYIADARGSGHAKSDWRSRHRNAMAGTFFDASQEGGVAESIRTEVLNLSKAPGDFWVLQMAEDGYTVEKFVYREGDYTVWYTLEPKIIYGLLSRLYGWQRRIRQMSRITC